MQIGADVYCDTAIILREIEARGTVAILCFLIAELCESATASQRKKPAKPPVKVQRPSAPAGLLDCLEHRRLAAEHLKAIAEWKKTFDDADAWQKTLHAEEAVRRHCRVHGCQTASGGSPTGR